LPVWKTSVPVLRCGGVLSKASKRRRMVCWAPGATANARACAGSSEKAWSVPAARVIPETAQAAVPSLPRVTYAVAELLSLTLPKSTLAGETTSQQPTSMSADSGTDTVGRFGSVLWQVSWAVR
jgi:hypothetical protein